MICSVCDQLFEDKISCIYALHKAGFDAKAIVEHTGVAQHTVERWHACCHTSTSDTPPKLLPKSGWPRKCSQRLLT